MTVTAASHGTPRRYKNGCRCAACTTAVRRYENLRRVDLLTGRSRTLANIGTIRRLQALRALGWPSRVLAEKIGVDERNISRWPHRTWISRTHHDAVRRVYDELSATPGPDTRARLHAARRGWLPPLWWDDDRIDDPTYTPTTTGGHHGVDDIAVERAIAGDPVRLTIAERAVAIQLLTDQGVSAIEIARRLRINPRTVARHRDITGVA